MSASPLTPDRLAVLQQWFEAAIELDDAARGAFVQAREREDAALGIRLRGLLAAHDMSASALERPVATIRAEDAEEARWIGRRVGAFEITRTIGMGGMGAVYEAVRADDEFRQRVAIKLIRAQTMSDTALRRFRRERQILATLQHPNIAQLLDGGVTTDGHPYFAMEFVEGEPLTTYCDSRRLSIQARLELFRQVCAAVEFAHQSLVVHRDLKPQNILVTADGQVKLLDFGIAALLPSALDDPSDEANSDTLTQAGLRVLTPAYASPEQRQGRAVGTRSDVYSLGVVLYELLCGRRPFDQKQLLRDALQAYDDSREPSRPSEAITSERLGTLSEASGERARGRVAGDLDAIVLKALRADPARRYGSAAEFSDDLQRHLTGRPVRARPDSFGYRVSKLLRRRRAESVAVLLVLLSIGAGSFVALRQARVADREKVRAQREQARALEVTRFLTTMLGAANPGVLGRDVKVREVLDSAVVRADALTTQPELEAEVRMVIGGTFLALGEFDRAAEQYRRAIDAEKRVMPDGGRGAAVAYSQLSMAREFEGDYSTADSLLRIADTLFAAHGFADAEQQISHLDARGRILSLSGKTKEAEPVLAEALRLQLLKRPVNDSSISASYTNLAVVQSDLGDNRSAETLMVAAVAAVRRAYGQSHPLVAAILSPLASVQERAGYLTKAESTFRETITMRESLLGADHPDLAWTMYNFAVFLLTAERYAESVDWSRRVLALRGRSLTDEHPLVPGTMSVLGRALDGLDSLQAGGYWLQEALTLRKRILPAGHFLLASSEGHIGEHLALEGRYSQAEPLLRKSEAALVAARGNAAPMVKDARLRLVKLYEQWKKPDSVRVWQQRIAEAAKAN